MAEVLRSQYDIGTPEGYFLATQADPSEHIAWHALMMGPAFDAQREILSREAQLLSDELEISANLQQEGEH